MAWCRGASVRESLDSGHAEGRPRHRPLRPVRFGTDVLSARRLPASHGVIDTSLETRAVVLVSFG